MLKSVAAKFMAISGVGWLLDLFITIFLVSEGITPFIASAIGAAAAVTFVYVISRLKVFADRRLGGGWDYILYVLWQAFAIFMASVLVAWLTTLIHPTFGRLTSMTEPLALASGVAKVLVTPLTLTANFKFMSWLTYRGKDKQSITPTSRD